MSTIMQWAKANGATRSEAIRRLVEIGLVASANASDQQRYQAKASESAGKAAKLAGELGLRAKAK